MKLDTILVDENGDGMINEPVTYQIPPHIGDTITYVTQDFVVTKIRHWYSGNVTVYGKLAKPNGITGDL